MASTPREIGTLIVVVLRANHLPNKRHIGKQDPYCLVTVNGEKRRTKAIKRGGQHPEWDEEIRFTLYEDVEDVLARTAHGDNPPPPPPKEEKKQKSIKGGKSMKVACYADDPREPDLIGDVDVDLTEVLTKGETDEWFTLTNKDKFAGKVYLELTFWSNEPPPEKKVTAKPPKANKQYGGPGSFVPSGELPPGSRIASASAAYNDHARQHSDVIPSSLRASSSAANLDLYVAPYERNRASHVDNLVRDFGEFGVSAGRRRESFPPVPTQYAQEPQHLATNYSTFNSHPTGAYGYEQSIPDTGSVYPYDRPISPNGQVPAHYQQSSASTLHGYGSSTYAASTYEVASPTSYQHTARGPRHSVPTASSGFVPLPQASGFMPMSSHVSEPSGFGPPPSHTPAPGFSSQFHSQPQSVYHPIVSHTPAPPNTGSYLQHSTSLSYPPQQSFSASQSYNDYNYGIPSSVSAPPQQFVSAPAQPNVPPQTNSAPPQLYTSVSSPHEQTSPNIQLPHSNGQSSRPLPQQPQVIYNQQPQQPIQSPPLTTSHSLPPPNTISQTANSYSPTQPGNIYPSNAAYSSIPPPPPPPLQQYNTPAPLATNTHALPIPPPPPPPLQSSHSPQPYHRASLPQPPIVYQPQQQQQQEQQQQQQPMYSQNQPPPPPPPIDYYSQNPLPPPPPPPPLLDQTHISQNGSYHQGLLPKPPTVNEYGQWIQPPNSEQTSQAY